MLDQADTSLDFVSRREGVRPIHIERLNGEFLLNYSEFSFFVNRNGWRARPDWKIDWEGLPQNFALSYPWILAFEPNFIEIRNIETQTVHIIPSKNIRMLHTSTREVCTYHVHSQVQSGSSRAQRDAIRASMRSASTPAFYMPSGIPEDVIADARTSYAYHASACSSGAAEEPTIPFKVKEAEHRRATTPLPESPSMDYINKHPQILYAYEDEQGQDVVASIDFWLGRRPDAHMSIMPPAHSPEPAPQLPPLSIGSGRPSSQAR